MSVTSSDPCARPPRDLVPALLYIVGALVVATIGQLSWWATGLGPGAAWTAYLPTFATMVWVVDIGLVLVATGALLWLRGALRRPLIFHAFLLMALLDLALPQMLMAV
ncbi:MAG: hypothetical protein AAFR47_08005 [Pseudomonadota bacterium]